MSFSFPTTRIFKVALAGSIALALTGTTLVACTSQADTASRNISTDAENFKIQRRIAATNAITDKIVLEATGRCSVETADSALGPGAFDLTCKVRDDEYFRHTVIPGDNTNIVIQQLDTVDVSVYHTKIRFAPETLIPEFELNVGDQ